MSTLWKAVPPLLVGLLGAGGAWLWYTTTWWLPVLILGVGIAIGFVGDWYGRQQLPDYPKKAVRYMEWWITLPVCVAAIAASGLIILGVFLEPGENASVQTKKLTAALAAAVAGFGTAAFIRNADEADKNWIAERIKTAFEQKYKQSRSNVSEKAGGVWYFPPESDPLLWVHAEYIGGVSGWEREARRRRADELSKFLEQQTPSGLGSGLGSSTELNRRLDRGDEQPRGTQPREDRELIEQRGCRLVYLPPYSLDYKPIEEDFAKIMNLLRQAARSGESLIEAIAGALCAVTTEDVRYFFGHVGFRLAGQLLRNAV